MVSPLPSESLIGSEAPSTALRPTARSRSRNPTSSPEADATSELAVLGRKLAAARQSQGLSLDQLADRLCLGTSQLQALECADRSLLPEDVFVIAQARRVAASLGIDADQELAAVRSGQPQTPERPSIQSGLELDPGAASHRSPWRRASVRLGALALALGLLALAITTLARRHAEPGGSPARSSLPAEAVASTPSQHALQSI